MKEICKNCKWILKLHLGKYCKYNKGNNEGVPFSSIHVCTNDRNWNNRYETDELSWISLASTCELFESCISSTHIKTVDITEFLLPFTNIDDVNKFYNEATRDLDQCEKKIQLFERQNKLLIDRMQKIKKLSDSELPKNLKER